MVFDFSDVGQWFSTRGNVTPSLLTSEQLATSEDIFGYRNCGEWKVVPGIQQVKATPPAVHRTPFQQRMSVECQSRSCARLFATPRTVAHKAPLSMGFSRQECWSGLLFPSPGVLLTQRLIPGLLHCRQILAVRARREGATITLYRLMLGSFLHVRAQVWRSAPPKL